MACVAGSDDRSDGRSGEAHPATPPPTAANWRNAASAKESEMFKFMSEVQKNTGVDIGRPMAADGGIGEDD